MINLTESTSRHNNGTQSITTQLARRTTSMVLLMNTSRLKRTVYDIPVLGEVTVKVTAISEPRYSLGTVP